MRSEERLHQADPELARRLRWAIEQFEHEMPTVEVEIAVVHRSVEEQDRLYAIGRTAPGKPITNSKGGRSLHNYSPAYAVEVAMIDRETGEPRWEWNLFSHLATFARAAGVEWGGLWKSVKNGSQFQAPQFTWQMARDGEVPLWPGVELSR